MVMCRNRMCMGAETPGKSVCSFLSNNPPLIRNPLPLNRRSCT
ncbi:Uncharacterized protein APZ42_030400 [Daphnia magna]|uniref:Uncharacterized protein n=1 Tax=Daphnia magna TaxID=35525 RepID=A0A164NSW7_9CRUS|nr:Uncharacterized protein APZ42_030400 [Daphnia magna]